ncbi:TPA: hypothetical protein ACQUH6_001837 [Neisseria polysaccharea]
MRETCFRCKHADFKTNLDTPMSGFAKCAKARNAEEKATYYPRTNPCVTGAFQTASEAAMRKRRQTFGEPPSDSNPTERK